MTPEEIDKTGLIREAYGIDGIGAPECRSIFVDWALKLPASVDARDAISLLLQHYAKDRSDHPMTAVLREGLHEARPPRRRGGRGGRLGGA